MRVLAIDYGTKRIGIAVSDPTGTLAVPLETIPATPFDKFLERLRQIIQEKEVSLILVGMPRSLSGEYGESANKVREFVDALKETIHVPIKTWDERLTTVQAQRSMLETGEKTKSFKKKIDRMAAAVLLQSYLDSRG
ncbi:MAG: Holliday junction resolvase RuvX [Verrucomicrobiae bacterium]|nr:Holliday junction resolvase RuvX [Verrucomicrobiae bacterium]